VTKATLFLFCWLAMMAIPMLFTARREWPARKFQLRALLLAAGLGLTTALAIVR